MSDLKTAIVIAGMHRSGTSSIAGAASILGASLPKHLMAAHEGSNPLGHFESQKIVDLNDAILSNVGSRWNDWREIPDQWLKSDFAHECRATALDLMVQEYDGAPLIVLKDPRICRLLPFWGPILEEAGYRGSVFLPYRNPFEVAASLTERNGFSRGEGLLLWLRHALESERATRDQPRDFLFWPDFLEDPVGALTRSAERIGFTWPRVSDFSLAELDEFVSRDLRHNKTATLRNGQVGEWVVAAFKAFRQLDAEPGSKVALATLDSIRAELNRAGQLFGPAHVDFELRLDRVETARGATEVRLNETAAELERVRADRDGLEAQVHHAAAEAAAQRLVLEAETARRAEFEAALASAQAALASTQAAAKASAQAAAQAEAAKLAELEAVLARVTSERNSALSAVVERKADLAQFSFHLNERRDVRRWHASLSQELATEVGKVLRQPWRPLAQRLLYFVFSALTPVPGRAGEFFKSQALQRTPRRLQGIIDDVERVTQRMPYFQAEDDRLLAIDVRAEDPLSPAQEEAPPTDLDRRILVADYRIPRPDVSAGERATVGILQDLCDLGYQVTFLPTDMRPSGRYEADLRRMGVQVITQQSGHGGVADFVEKFGRQFGIFYLIRVDVAEVVLPAARKVAPAAQIIFHAPDLYFLREKREAEFRGDQQSHRRAAETYHREIAMMSASDHVVLISPAEVPVLRRALTNTPISVFPGLYASVVDDPRGFQARRHIFFLGGFAHTPNVDAVQWFATEIWPHVHAALPDVEFHIVGAEAPPSVVELGQLPGIKVVGFVPDLTPVLETYRVGVAPLLFGAGIKGKVATTMGAGIPCVCTPIAAEGMGLQPGVHALIEEEPRRFAEAVVTLYKEEALWSRLSTRGRALIADRFGTSANRASLFATLNDARALSIQQFIRYCQTTEPAAVPAPEDDVDVSIIIPVYNKWELTRACITSVLQTCIGTGIRFEVILADDNSTDETVRAAEIFPGLRIAKTPKNLGFLRNCNHAARAARGRYLLLLNNDTVVLPGWLEALFRSMENDPAIGIAGSKLLYPDKVIQEAGGAIFRDASARNIGRGQERDNPLFNVAREADYISGASILIRADFWNKVGGFDERYKTAYYEDTDLAMSARAHGLVVWYEPKSELIHFEHQSYQDQEEAGPSALMQHNAAVFLEKWKDVLLRDHGEPNHDPWTVPPAARSRAVGALKTVA